MLDEPVDHLLRDADRPLQTVLLGVRERPPEARFELVDERAAIGPPVGVAHDTHPMRLLRDGSTLLTDLGEAPHRMREIENARRRRAWRVRFRQALFAYRHEPTAASAGC